MYKNIGKKIKAVAKVFAWIGIILFVLIGLIMAGVAGVMEGEPGLIVAGIIVAVVGALVSWISSFMVYGFVTISTLLPDLCCIIEFLFSSSCPQTYFMKFTRTSWSCHSPQYLSPLFSGIFIPLSPFDMMRFFLSASLF